MTSWIACFIHDRRRHYFSCPARIREAPEHERALELLGRQILDVDVPLALAPQVLTEFLHIVTDPKRFQNPLSMADALSKARLWWTAREVFHVYPTAESTTLFLEWLGRHGLGRKRLLDTHLAATYWAAGVRRILTSNARDFAVFENFESVSP